MGIDPTKVQVPRGGEEIPFVLGRREEDEMPTYILGAVTLPFRPAFRTKWYQQGLINASVVGQCGAVTHPGVTLFFQRYEYANLWHTMNNWFNTHRTLESLGVPRGQRIRIVFLDGHAKSSVDEVWATAFNAEVLFVKQLPASGTCFEQAVWVPKNTPFW